MNTDNARERSEIAKQDFIKIKDLEIKFYFINALNKSKRYNWVTKKVEYILLVNYTPVKFDTEEERDRVALEVNTALVENGYISLLEF